MIDFHSHILPHIDDGSSSLQVSLEMLQMEAQQGITHVVATPHFYAQETKLERFMERRDHAERKLRCEMEKHSGLPQLLVGAEVSFFRGVSETEFLPELTIGGTNSVLIEMPATPWEDYFYAELKAIWERRRIVPIVAHIDRYINFWNCRSIMQNLAQLPVLVQANAESFVNRRSAARMQRLLQQDLVHLIGSDCHDLAERVPNIADAVERITQKLGPDALTRVHTYEEKFLQQIP